MVGTGWDNQTGSASALLVAQIFGGMGIGTAWTRTSDADGPCTRGPLRVPATLSREEPALPRLTSSRTNVLPGPLRRLVAFGGRASRPACGTLFQEPS